MVPVLILVTIVFLITIVSIKFITLYNSIVEMNERCNNAFEYISVQIQSRFEILEKIGEMIAKYDTHESQTLLNIVQMRKQGTRIQPADLAEQDVQMYNVQQLMNVLAEGYPELKASELYKEFIAQSDKYETNVRISRQVYNDTVARYNMEIKMFPNNIFLSIMKVPTEEKQYLN